MFLKIIFCIPVVLIQSNYHNNYNTLHIYKPKLHISLNKPTYKQYTTLQVWRIKILFLVHNVHGYGTRYIHHPVSHSCQPQSSMSELSAGSVLWVSM